MTHGDSQAWSLGWTGYDPVLRSMPWPHSRQTPRGIPETSVDSCFEHSDIRLLNLFRISCFGFRTPRFPLIARPFSTAVVTCLRDTVCPTAIHLRHVNSCRSVVLGVLVRSVMPFVSRRRAAVGDGPARKPRADRYGKRTVTYVFWRPLRRPLGLGVSIVIAVVFVIGIINLVMGFTLAILLERQLTIPVPVLRTERPDMSDEVIYEVPAAALTLDEVRDELPARWFDLLENSDEEFSTFVEASVEILKLEVETYREDLLDIEDLVRSALNRKNSDAVQAALQEFIALNDEWVVRQSETLSVLAARRHQLGEYCNIGSRFETLLLDQSARIEDRCKSIVQLDLKHDEQAGDQIISGVGELVQLAHELRDSIREATLMIVCNEKRLESSDRRQHFDELTGLQNRMGLELLFNNWWREDLNRTRLVSAALIDIDHFGQINDRLSTRVGDRFLTAIARYLEQLTAKESGLDRVFRYGGQSFFVVFGDTGSRSAATDMERIRQTIEATKFEYEGGQHSLTIRSGLTQVRRDDDTVTLFARVEELAANARHAGRNRTWLEDATGNGVIQPEPKQAKRRVVTVE